MRGVFPIVIVVLGLCARQYVDRHLPGGLAEAELPAVVQLARETAVSYLERSPRGRQIFRETLPNRHNSRSLHLRRRSQHQRNSPSNHMVRTRIRLGGEQIRFRSSEQPISVRFVLPVDKPSESASHRSGRGTRRRP
jgi:hypothetical protein